jgi:hypothetical protein
MAPAQHPSRLADRFSGWCSGLTIVIRCAIGVVLVVAGSLRRGATFFPWQLRQIVCSVTMIVMVVLAARSFFVAKPPRFRVSCCVQPLTW